VNLRNNLTLKLVALFLAFAAWVYVHSQSDIQRAVVIPLDLSGLPDEFIEVSDAVPDVTVHLRGPETFLGGLPPERVRVQPELAEQALRVGSNNIPLDINMVRAPAGITVERISPAFVELELDELVTKEVRVEPAVQGQPAPGYEIAQIVSAPASLTVRGPRQVLSDVESISTSTVSVQGARETKRQSARPLVVGANPALVSPMDARTDIVVEVRIRPLQEEATFTGVPVRAVGTGEAAPGISPATVTVRARGPRDKVAALVSADMLVQADLGGRGRSELELPTASLRVIPAPGRGNNLAGLDLEVIAPAVLRVTWPE
jgi:YbbR domain-containing protein